MSLLLQYLSYVKIPNRSKIPNFLRAIFYVFMWKFYSISDHFGVVYVGIRYPYWPDRFSCGSEPENLGSPSVVLKFSRLPGRFSRYSRNRPWKSWRCILNSCRLAESNAAKLEAPNSAAKFPGRRRSPITEWGLANIVDRPAKWKSKTKSMRICHLYSYMLSVSQNLFSQCVRVFILRDFISAPKKHKNSRPKMQIEYLVKKKLALSAFFQR